MRGIYSVAPRNFSCGKPKHNAGHGALPHVEKDFATSRNCHAWWSQPLLRMAKIYRK